jgi:hypothetical protein
MFIEIRIPKTITSLLVEKGKNLVADASLVTDRIVITTKEGIEMAATPRDTVTIPKILFSQFVEVGENMILSLNSRVDIRKKSMRIKSIEAVAKKASIRRAMQNNDEVKELVGRAQVIADRYSRELLGQRRFDLAPRSKELKTFIEAARHLRDFSKHTNIPEEKLLKYVMKIVYQVYTERGKRAHTAFFSSKHLWKEELPQYIRQIIPGYNFDKIGDKERILAKNVKEDK